MANDLRSVMDEIRQAADRAAVRTVDYLASPGGQRLRRRLAGAMILAAPMLFKVPGLRRYPVVRLIEVLGGAAVVIELARLIRDWQPETADRLEAAVAEVSIQPAGAGGPNGHRGRAR